ncbi:mobilization protein [Pedobacter sp. KBW01]|uniref:plasmid mobilization protein n=1 Tax=Pedobacter sp. KBW01 TaxID=2153364 RepID=UPI000F59025A|nr:mobilization protein [Pedobacter sp. KBW01]RQO77816.1 mobilization protein [Pedobacter sp. KBW01]
MAGKKREDRTKLLSHVLRIRIDQQTYEKLHRLVDISDCRSPCAAARKIITGGRINVFHHDNSMGPFMEELSRIRKEIRAIGININQQTHYFHQVQSSSEKWFYVNRTLEEHKKTDQKIELLLQIVGELAKKWLSKSEPEKR